MRISNINKEISFKSAASQKIAQRVADVILSYRRPFQKDTLSRSNYSYLSGIISKKITPSIDKAEPVPVAIVGFSMKSPNTKKVISDIADRTEFETIDHLNNLTHEIKSVYPFGSDFKIYADGRIFVGTIYGSSDKSVSKYVRTNKEFLERIQSDEIKIVSANDFFTGNDSSVRKELFSQFPVNKEEMEGKISSDPFLRPYRHYMRDFYAKDIHAINPSISCKESRKLGDKAALGVICAAESYDKFINSLYKRPCLRLSVHSKPVFDKQEKIGIFLNKLKENLPTPWHSAAAKITKPNGEDCFIYEKKNLLEKAGCIFTPDTDGKGAYYTFPKNIKYDFSKSFKENLIQNFAS